MIYNYYGDSQKPVVLKDPIDIKNQAVDDLNIGGLIGGFENSFSLGFGRANQFDRKKQIKIYRSLALYDEVDNAINHIVNDMIYVDDDKELIKLNLDNIDSELDGISKNIKEKMNECFEDVLYLLNFRKECYNILRQFYIDGVMYYQVVEGSKGIQKIINLDPLKVTVVNNVKYKRVKDVDIVSNEDKVYKYEKNGNSKPILIDKNNIVYCDSGYYIDIDWKNSSIKVPISYLQKAIKLINCLHNLEDSIVMYRIVKGVERQVHYVDIGNRSPNQAKQYMADYIANLNNKVEYNSKTGEIVNNNNQVPMLQNIYVPRTATSNSEIDTIGGNTQFLNDLSDIEHIKKRAYKALNVPYSRLEDENQGLFGRASEISREELNHYQFIVKLRNQFNTLLLSLLKKQLIRKKIMTEDLFNSIKEKIGFIYSESNYITQLKQLEMMNNRYEVLRNLDEYEGKYISRNFIYKNVFNMTKEEKEEEIKQMLAEKAEKKKLGIDQEEEF
jgi:hypothetical protein